MAEEQRLGDLGAQVTGAAGGADLPPASGGAAETRGRRSPGGSSGRRRAIEAAGRELDQILSTERGEVDEDVVEIVARDLEISEASEKKLARARSLKRERFYSDLVFTIAGIRYVEHEAQLHWVNLLTHKWEMSERMGRNVGIRVAALDYFTNVVRDLTEVRILAVNRYVETERLAVTDDLTGLFNHRYLQEKLLREIQRAGEGGECFSLLMIDIDRFKRYNDAHGHVAGDVALREVAEAIHGALKQRDMVARYGGEEFAAILSSLEKREAVEVAERVRSRVEEMPGIGPEERMTISVGVAEYPGDGRTRSDLIQAADTALYAAKRLGRNRVCAATM